MFLNLIFVSGVPWLGEIVFKAHTLAEAEHYLADNSLSEVKKILNIVFPNYFEFSQKSWFSDKNPQKKILTYWWKNKSGGRGGNDFSNEYITLGESYETKLEQNMY